MKAQNSFEFLIMTSIMFFLFIALLYVITNYSSNVEVQNTQKIGLEIAKEIANQITLAASASSNYQSTFTSSYTTELNNYQVTFNPVSNAIVVTDDLGSQQVLFVEDAITASGEICLNDTNIICKKANRIWMYCGQQECSGQVTCDIQDIGDDLPCELAVFNQTITGVKGYCEEPGSAYVELWSSTTLRANETPSNNISIDEYHQFDISTGLVDTGGQWNVSVYCFDQNNALDEIIEDEWSVSEGSFSSVAQDSLIITTQGFNESVAYTVSCLFGNCGGGNVTLYLDTLPALNSSEWTSLGSPSDTPYINGQNMYNLTDFGCPLPMLAGDNCTIQWEVIANGQADQTLEFRAIIDPDSPTVLHTEQGIVQILLRTSLPSAFYSDNMILYMSFEENESLHTDLSGYDNHGQEQGDATTVPQGKFGDTLSLTGSGYVNITDTSGFTDENITAIAWIRAPERTDNREILSVGTWSAQEENRSLAYTMRIHDSLSGVQGLEVYMTDAGNSTGNITHYRTTMSVDNNSWNMVSFKYTQGALELYVNGQKETVIKDSDDTLSSIYDTTTGVYIGELGDFGHRFVGLIDEVLVWNESLTDAQIEEIYDYYTREPSAYFAQEVFGLWHFDGDVEDSGPLNQTTTNQGAEITPFGIDNQAYLFETLEYVEINNLSINDLEDGFTYSAWVRTNDLLADEAIIFGASQQAPIGHEPWFQCGQKDATGNLRFSTGSFTSNAQLDTVIQDVRDNVWHHIVCSWDANQGIKALYLDGQQITNTTATVNDTTIDYGFQHIGARLTSDPEGWNGTIDEVAIWNRSLTDYEVQEIYEFYDTASICYDQGDGFATGDGSVSDPWGICNCQMLQDMRDDVTAHYLLTKDVDCTETVDWNSGDGFEAITSFSGSLDGNYYTVQNLFIDSTSESAALFTSISGGEVQNIGLVNVSLTTTSFSARSGGIVGTMTGGLINNSYVTGIINAVYAAGLASVVQTNAIINNSYAIMDITSTYFPGGLTGGLTTGSMIENSYAAGNITGNLPFGFTYSGGITGVLNSGVLHNVFSDTKISGTSFKGGIVGQIFGTNTITNAYWNNRGDNPSEACYTSPADCSTTVGISDTNEYFYSLLNQPMASWNQQVWYVDGSDYPKLHWQRELSISCQGIQNDYLVIRGQGIFCDQQGVMWSSTLAGTYAWHLPGDPGHTLNYSQVDPTDQINFPAGYACEHVEFAGYTDWQLPTCTSYAPDDDCQFHKFYDQACQGDCTALDGWDINNQATGVYWTDQSTSTTDLATYMFAGNGIINDIDKDTATNVRCVRQDYTIPTNTYNATQSDTTAIDVVGDNTYLYLVGDLVKSGSSRMVFLNKYDKTDGSLVANTSWASSANTLISDYGYGIDMSGSNLTISGTSQGTFQEQLLLKYDTDLNFQWVEYWNETNKNIGYDTIIDGDTNIVVAGIQDPVVSVYEIILTKYSTNGGYIWNRTWALSSSDYAYTLVADDVSALYLAGTTDSAGPGTAAMVLQKYSANSLLDWNITWGGIYPDKGFALGLDTNGDIIVGGSYGTGSGTENVLAKFTPSGKQIWNTTWAPGIINEIRAIGVDQQANIYSVGSSRASVVANGDVILSKHTPAGQLVWNTSWGIVSEEDNATGIYVNDEDEVYIVGTTTQGAGSQNIVLARYS